MLQRAARLKSRRPYLQEGMVLLAPAEPREIQHHPGLLDVFRPIRAAQLAASIGAIEDEVAHTLGMPDRVLDRDGTTSTGAHQSKAPERCSLDYALEIAHRGLERKIIDAPVRKPAASGVVPQRPVLVRENVEPRPPGKAAPLMLKMGEPSRRHHQRRAFPAHRVGEAHTINRRTEPNALLHNGNHHETYDLQYSRKWPARTPFRGPAGRRVITIFAWTVLKFLVEVQCQP